MQRLLHSRSVADAVGSYTVMHAAETADAKKDGPYDAIAQDFADTFDKRTAQVQAGLGRTKRGIALTYSQQVHVELCKASHPSQSTQMRLPAESFVSARGNCW
jgi:hypothetical protein